MAVLAFLNSGTKLSGLDLTSQNPDMMFSGFCFGEGQRAENHNKGATSFSLKRTGPIEPQTPVLEQVRISIHAPTRRPSRPSERCRALGKGGGLQWRRRHQTLLPIPPPSPDLLICLNDFLLLATHTACQGETHPFPYSPAS